MWLLFSAQFTPMNTQHTVCIWSELGCFVWGSLKDHCRVNGLQQLKECIEILLVIHKRTQGDWEGESGNQLELTFLLFPGTPSYK